MKWLPNSSQQQKNYRIIFLRSDKVKVDRLKMEVNSVSNEYKQNSLEELVLLKKLKQSLVN